LGVNFAWSSLPVSGNVFFSLRPAQSFFSFDPVLRSSGRFFFWAQSHHMGSSHFRWSFSESFPVSLFLSVFPVSFFFYSAYEAIFPQACRFQLNLQSRSCSTGFFAGLRSPPFFLPRKSFFPIFSPIPNSLCLKLCYFSPVCVAVMFMDNVRDGYSGVYPVFSGARSLLSF